MRVVVWVAGVHGRCTPSLVERVDLFEVLDIRKLGHVANQLGIFDESWG